VNLNLPKSFQMMKLLNHDHGPIMRGLAAGVAFLAVFILTRRPVLAGELAGCFWTKNDFKLGARRGAWYARRSWLKLEVSQDDFFDPTEGMTDAQLDGLERFMIARKAKLEPVSYAADRAFIAARRLDNDSAPKQRIPNITAFKATCDALLVHAGSDLPQTLKQKKPRQGDFPIEGAKQALADFLDLFPLDQMPWFFVSGTFLGLVREKGFLAHDYDIDLGIFEDQIDIAATCNAILASDAFVLKKYDYHRSSLFTPDTVSKNPDVPYILKIIHTSGIHIDLFIHYRDTSKTPVIYWHGSSLHRWENSAFEVIPYPFYDHEVLGPADADTYLTENYGDWRTPVTEFNCTTDTPNLALVPHPIAVVIFVKRYVFAKAFDPAEADQIKAELVANGFLVPGPDDTLQFSGDLFAG
jgi:phosphorylcholine metabolism protein LicD